MNLNHSTVCFADINKAIDEIASTENSYTVTTFDPSLCNINRYSDYGLTTFGQLIGFPAKFVKKIDATNSQLAKEIISDRLSLYLNQDKDFVIREFGDKICGVVSNNYAFFDDNQVASIISKSPLANKPFSDAYVSPERLHLRAIDKENPFTIGNDKSPLYFCYFIDNSMVGQSAFKVTLGIYRLVCKNGLLVEKSRFSICKQIHRGTRDISAEFNKALTLIDSKRDSIIEMLTDMATAPAKIEELKEDVARAYLAKTLVLTQKETNKLLNLYHFTYGGNTKWAMANAITELARDVDDIEKRIQLESKALLVA